MNKRKQPLFAIYDNADQFMYATRMNVSDMRRLVSNLEGAAFEVTDEKLVTDPTNTPRRRAILQHTSIVLPESVIFIAESLLPEEERTPHTENPQEPS